MPLRKLPVLFITGLLLLLATISESFAFQIGTDQSALSGLRATLISDSLQSYLKYKAGTIAFTEVNVIDGLGGPVRKNQTVIIENGHFSTIGDDGTIEIPSHALQVNLRGKTMIPGLVGMHNHLHFPQFPEIGEASAKLYLAAGVTTIQTCGAASAHEELKLSSRISNGQFPGPEIIPSAPFITGPGGNPNMIIPRDEAHLRDTIQYWIDKGVRWFKVYRNTKPEDLKTAIEVAHANNARVRGHLCSITFKEATEMGIDGIEHGLNSTSDFRTNKTFGQCDGGREYIDELQINSEEVIALQQQMIDKGVFMTSTLSVFEASVAQRAYADARALKAMSPYLKGLYEERRKAFDKEMKDETRLKRLKRMMAFEYQYFKMGGLLCSGVDAGRHVLPGFGDQRNFELFLEAGFSTEEAIQVMTSNGARALNRNDIGSISSGKRASFVILNGDLTANSKVIEKVETVFKNGLGFDPQIILNEMQGKFGL
ncbi:amidohydrolase family protein [Roseivirga sp.]|uniref:amidohydrolase family protein n=1 Tax=Roseivirga sp. TaxID=1964215 RepID=UPI003B523D13